MKCFFERHAASSAAILLCFVPLLTPSAARAEETNGFVTFSGHDWAKDSHYMYQGIVAAINRDLSKDGVVVRVFGGIADYSYELDPNIIDGKGYQADILVGYQRVEGPLNASFYAGFDYQHQKLKPDDPENPVNGTDVGFKVLGEISSPNDAPMYVSVTGSYSTAFETYWNRAVVMFDFGRFKAGPEGVMFGNEGFSAKRIGGTATFDVNLLPSLPVSVYVNAGRQIVDEDDPGAIASSAGGTGAYVGFGFSTSF